MIAKAEIPSNGPLPISAALLDALACDLAAAGIHASAPQLLRFLARTDLVQRPSLLGDADGPHR